MEGARSEPTPYIVIDQCQLEADDESHTFHGIDYPDTNVSFIWIAMPPGGRVRLHRHAYQEIFIVQEGRATYTVGSDTLEVVAPKVVVAPPGVPHGFANTGDTVLRQVDIHVTSRILTEWLE
jgi:mannose-6-phosphate isomerase-like protein (cupin superfamily)